MPLQKQLLQVPLSAGLGQKEDVRGLQPVQAATMQNCVRLKNGAIRKRAGTGALSKSVANTSGTIAQALAGGAHKQSMWMQDQKNLYVWSDHSGAWNQLCSVPEATALDRIPAIALPQNIVDCDFSVAANGLLYVIGSSLSPLNGALEIYLTVLDGSSGGGLQQGATASVVVPMQPIALSANRIAPKIIACGNRIVITWVNINGDIAGASYDATNPSAAATTATIAVAAALSSGAQAGAYDVCPIVGDNARFMVVAGVGAGFPAIFLQSSTTLANLAQHNLTSLTVNPTSVAAYATSGGYLWAVVSAVVASKRTYYAGFYNEGSATTSTTSTLFFQDATTGIPMGKIGIAPANTDASGDVIGAVWSTGYASSTAATMSVLNNAYIQHATLTGSGTTVTVSAHVALQGGVQLSSRPIFGSQYANAYVAVNVPSTLQGTVYLCELPTWQSPQSNTTAVVCKPVATLSPRLQKSVSQPMAAGGSLSLPHLLPLSSIPSFASTVSGGLGVYGLPVFYSTSTFHNAVAIQPIDFYSSMGRASAALGDTTLMATGAPCIFDGQTVAEAGFCNYPEFTATPQGSGGSLSAGTYQYILTYEWYDAAGNVHRSATSPTVTVTAVNNDSVSITACATLSRRFPVLSTGLGGQPPALVVYRTTVGGSTFYRATGDPATTSSYLVAGLNLVVTDTVSDATLTASATAQILYTTGGLLDNFNPPSARVVFRHGQRWIVSGCDNPRQVWASKGLVDGEAPGFNEALAFFASGAVRAGVSMDGNMVLFVQRETGYGIEYVTGQGPTDTGAQSDWSQPIPIPANVGAVDQRGTCVGDFGCLFRSPVGGPNGTGGIFLLSRDLQVSYVSGPVEGLLAACPIVTSMVVHPNAGCVYITTITSDASPATTGGATRLVWDYLQGGIWSSDVLYDTDAAAPGLAVRAAWVASAGGVSGALQAAAYHCASAGGRVYRENTTGAGAGAYLDAGSQWITMKYVSAPLKPDLNGFARFWRMQVQADSLEAADLTVQLLYDFAPASYYQESHTWTAPQIATFDRSPQVDLEMLCGNQKSKAIQVVLTDATPTGGGATTGQGMSWASLTLELGVKTGRYPNLPSAQRS